MVLDTFLLNTQAYKVFIKGKVEQSREKSSALSDTSVLEQSKKDPSGCLRLQSPTLLFIIFSIFHNNFLLILFTNPSARAGYDTRSIFKRSLTDFNSEFSFS